MKTKSSILPIWFDWFLEHFTEKEQRKMLVILKKRLGENDIVD